MPCTVMQGCSPTTRMFPWYTLRVSCCRLPWDTPLAASSRIELHVKALQSAVQVAFPVCFHIYYLFAPFVSLHFHLSCNLTWRVARRSLHWHCSSWKATSFLISPQCNQYPRVHPWAASICTPLHVSIEENVGGSHLVCTFKQPTLCWFTPGLSCVVLVPAR